MMSNKKLIENVEPICNFFWDNVKNKITRDMSTSDKEKAKNEILQILKAECERVGVSYEFILRVINIKNFYRTLHVEYFKNKKDC